MKTLRLFTTTILLLVFGAFANAQTADEILANYFENTGGIENWKSIEGMKMTGDAGFGPQSFPFVQIMMTDGRMRTEVDLQGQKFIPQAYDGEKMWGMNFQTMAAEEVDSETATNYKNNEANDFPDPFLNYKEKGYQVEYMGEETVEGVETYKLKLTKNKLISDGVEEDNFAVYYFDKENFVPILSENTMPVGPQKGMKVQTVYSDYQEAGDIFYPYSITTKFNGQAGQSIKIESIEINPSVEEVNFSMPTKE
ncbi:MAG: outer membrane lipoprotein-sorting protein [Flavobacteriaceae bacterium]|nr:outer membrane lipoprotein-sorting protein [Flavobacteriaceae bacterium]|tara:strand:- start:35174 stop:35932 length:759 start_codon:yes stop_codon:yes gene_type:complete